MEVPHKTKKIELPYDPTIPLLGTYPEKAVIQKDACTPKFIVALFTVARTWNLPKYLIEGQIKKEDEVQIHNGLLLSFKKEQYSAICRGMDGPETAIRSEASQKGENKCCIKLLTCGI